MPRSSDYQYYYTVIFKDGGAATKLSDELFTHAWRVKYMTSSGFITTHTGWAVSLEAAESGMAAQLKGMADSKMEVLNTQVVEVARYERVN